MISHLKSKCPNDGEKCSVSGGEIKESMILLGDNEQEYAMFRVWIWF